MTHGAPDWNKYRTTSATFPVQDLAELAARLGSLNVYDRRGDQIWADSFQNGLNKWETFTAGTGSAVAIDPTTARHGGYSCKLTAAAVASASAQINAFAPYPPSTTLGIEMHSTIDPDAERIGLQLHAFTADQQILGYIQYLHPTTTLQYLDANGTWQDLTTSLKLRARSDLFHIFKLVLNIQDQEYLRLIVDNQTYDLADIPLQVTATALYNHARTTVIVYGDGTNPASVNVDSIILTQDEP